MKPTANANRPFRGEDIDVALRRAALKARELGERTQTPVFVLRDGRIIDLRKEVAKAL